MKTIALLWRDHTGSVKAEKFAADDFHARTDGPWLKLSNKENDPFRWIPSDNVIVLEFIEEEEPSRIASPHAVSPAPFPTS